MTTPTWRTAKRWHYMYSWNPDVPRGQHERAARTCRVFIGRMNISTEYSEGSTLKRAALSAVRTNTSFGGGRVAAAWCCQHHWVLSAPARWRAFKSDDYTDITDSEKVTIRPYLTQSVYTVVLQESIPAQIRQLNLYVSDNEGYFFCAGIDL